MCDKGIKKVWREREKMAESVYRIVSHFFSPQTQSDTSTHISKVLKNLTISDESKRDQKLGKMTPEKKTFVQKGLPRRVAT